MKTIVPIALFLFAVALAPAREELRRAGSHEHSVAQGRLAVESGRLYLMLEIPGANLVGFEHPPRDDAQQRALSDALARLRDGTWLVLPPEAGCDASPDIEAPGFAPRAASGHDARGDGHGSDHGHNHDHDSAHEHAEFRISVSAECRAASPDWLEVRLFEGWPDNRLIRVDAITESNQFRAELTAEGPRIELR